MTDLDLILEQKERLEDTLSVYRSAGGYTLSALRKAIEDIKESLKKPNEEFAECVLTRLHGELEAELIFIEKDLDGALA